MEVVTITSNQAEDKDKENGKDKGYNQTKQKNILIHITHATLFTTFAFMTIFGAIMDAHYDKNAYKVVALTGAVTTSAHVAWWVGILACNLFIRKWNFLVLYINNMRYGLGFATFSACAFASIRVIGNTTHHTNGTFPYFVTLFDSVLVLCTCFLALQTIALTLFAFVFFNHRRPVWNTLTTDEAIILSHPSVTRAFACVDIASGLAVDAELGQFIRKWVNISDNAILDALPQQTQELYSILVSIIKPETQETLMITKDEYLRFINEKALSTSASDNIYENIENLWRLLSDGCQEDSGTVITPSSVERMLYEIAFRRKRFAHQVLTDRMCINWVIWDLGLLLYPFSALIIATLWGYTDMFGEGFDMFKTYLLSASFIAAQLRERVMFMATMTIRRPYDVGDVLLIDNKPFRINNFTPGHTYMEGNTARTVNNSVLIKDQIINLSRAHVSDGVRLSLPITASNECAQKVRVALDEYAKAKPDVISAGSIRVGWVGIEENVKVLGCNWRYSFEIHDVKRYNTMRTFLANYVIGSLGRDVSLAGLGFLVAQAGAFNDHAEVNAYVRDI
jgi:hypothetical protein